MSYVRLVKARLLASCAKVFKAVLLVGFRINSSTSSVKRSERNPGSKEKSDAAFQPLKTAQINNCCKAADQLCYVTLSTGGKLSFIGAWR